MSGLSGFGFAAPWFLAAFAALPALWYLLRIAPPQPRRIPFPPIRILRELTQREETPARTPPWLLALRLLIASLLILALSGPVLNPEAALSGSGPVVLVVDDGWAAAPDWEARQEILETLIDRAERSGRAVVLVGTARNAAAPEPLSLRPPAEARRLVRSLQPHPWGTDRAAAARRIAEADLPEGADVFWLSDGIADGGARQLGEVLRALGSVRVLSEPASRSARGLTIPAEESRALTGRVVRADAAGPESVEVLASTRNGLILGRGIARFGASDHEARVEFDLPPEVRNEVARLSLGSGESAGGVALLDESSAWRVVGVVSGDDLEEAQPLLSQDFYLKRALSPFAEVVEGSLAAVLRHKLSVLILADIGRIPEANAARLRDWVGKGGVLVRFAGPHLAQAQESAADQDALLPVPLRQGNRALGGLLSWAKPAHLAAFDRASPFFGLKVPPDVIVKRQVLPEPGPELSSRTWARLADGTPLVTGERRGEGWVVLFHTTASVEWSNLAVSGLYVGMLRRLVDLSQGVASANLESSALTLMPRSTLDGFGHLGAPPAEALPLRQAALKTVTPGPEHPPGFYSAPGLEGAGRALNLLRPHAVLAPIEELPAGLERRGFEASREVNLARWLLGAAIMLALLDGLVVLGLRGHLTPGFRRRRAGRIAAGVLILALCGSLGPVKGNAQEPGIEQATVGAESAPAAALETRLAYVRTGDARVDAMSRAGLVGLSRQLSDRTAFEPAEPSGVDPERDELVFYPVLYWPMTPKQKPLSPKAAAKIEAYMRNGGLILFDTRDQRMGFGSQLPGGEGTVVLRELLAHLDIPPLQPVPDNHVLTKSFYLLQTFPGRYNGGRVWVEASPSDQSLFASDTTDRDGVSPLVVGGNDWAAAWAVDDNGNPLAATSPDDERQRELAYRFGINLVMYALTGNYKADQVHVPALLERLGQ